VAPEPRFGRAPWVIRLKEEPVEIKFKDDIQLALDDVNWHRSQCYTCRLGANSNPSYACPTGYAFLARVDQTIACERAVRELNPELVKH
jgi:hypothetical protein